MNSTKCWLDEAGGTRVWRACVHCVLHGWVDEEIAWNDAKTAFKACQLARERHYGCGEPEKQQKDAERAFALEQIDMAREQLARYEERLAHARTRHDTLELIADDELVAEARVLIARAERDVRHARDRLADTIATNSEG